MPFVSAYLFGDLIAYLKRACPACDLGGGEREAGIGPVLFALAALAWRW